jgi:methionyl-tRNA synthetase
MSRFFITTPIYYINAEPHLGHAYTTLVADVMARAHRLMGDDTYFLTGTDEHGQKVERAAQKAGLSTTAFADRVSQKFRDLLPALNIANDDFIRTTEPRHHLAAQELWRRVRDRGHIYKGKYEGWYCTVDEVFVPDTQLVDGRCPICGNPVERIAEESYFFRLSQFQGPLIDYYKQHPDFVTPDGRRKEMLSFLEAGLDDLSVSRTSFKWGIPVPDDEAHVMYVWFDALTNYLTAVGYGRPDEAGKSMFARYWPADVHLIGKEIARQHAIYWPAFLMAADLPLPKQVVSHGWWLMEGAKMSKSKGNVVRPQDYIDKFGLDAFRYFVFREMAFGQDASFTDEAFLTRYNSDLANDLGNLISRATTMLHRYCGGAIPQAGVAALSGADEASLNNTLESAINGVRASTQRFRLELALREIWDAIGATNRYIVAREPWKLAKDATKRAELDTSLYLVADAVRIIAELLRPFIPGTAERTLAMLGLAADTESWKTLKRGDVRAGAALGETAALFPRIEHTVEELRQMSSDQASGEPTAGVPVQNTAAPTAAAPVDNRISIDDFMKIELRVATVLAAERVPKSNKLLKLLVDVGTEQRTIVAGIAEAYEPDTLIGRTIAIVFNLKPAKLMGVESNGMVLAASVEGGKPMLVGFTEPPPPGTRIR